MDYGVLIFIIVWSAFGILGMIIYYQQDDTSEEITIKDLLFTAALGPFAFMVGFLEWFDKKDYLNTVIWRRNSGYQPQKDLIKDKFLGE